ncbi:RND transporter [Raoultella planticola]|uniref:RND transporter n=1 Tax=Raoultella planticola TaxID=575 RepID=A0ABU5M4F0_RAOPL|nr:RND transporter [Raoultella planticola]MDW4552793.1 RND transporter [Raoultella planticola]MDZ7446252.1 RND transporter [Raoultella planticola]MDZ7467089.1 RND transporter [Raoultella planticola]MDZ7504863.1 RND transporter [Raoultella planticola]MEA5394422.1 RND transporter [Raoultella planticola]
MNSKELLSSVLILISLTATTYAADCEPNYLGGQFCINDDGTTSDSMPNEAGGVDTYSNNGKWTSTVPDVAGEKEAIDGATLAPQDQAISSSPSETDSALMGKDWNSASNIQSDGAATSSAAIINSQ